MTAKTKIRVVTFTKAEDAAYGKLMGDFGNSGLSDLKATPQVAGSNPEFLIYLCQYPFKP